MPMTDAEMRKMYGIPPNAKVTLIDMGPGKAEPTTEGWTDDQIRGKSIDDLNSLISQNELALKIQRESIEKQQKVVDGLMRVRQRKIDIGG